MKSKNASDFRDFISQQKGRKGELEKQAKVSGKAMKEKKHALRRHERAREIIRIVGLKTQQQLQYHISEITSLAMEAIFPDPYSVVAEFVERRNKTECDIFFQQDEMKVHPLTATGGGAVDVASFALRAASWSMQRPRSRSVLFLDEPFRNLSVDLMPAAAAAIKELSTTLKLQIVLVTHKEALAEIADKLFRTSIKEGVTRIANVS